MDIRNDVVRQIENIIEEEKRKKEEGKKISSGLLSAARELDATLNKLEHDLDTLKARLHESELDDEFKKIKDDLRSKISSALSN